MGIETFFIYGACLGGSCYCWSLGRGREGLFEVLGQMVMWPWLSHGRAGWNVWLCLSEGRRERVGAPWSSDSSPSSGSCPCCDLRKPLWSLKTWSQEHLSWDFPSDSGAVWADGQAMSLLRERFGYLETLLGKESEAAYTHSRSL